MENVIKHIEQLLYRHDCVIIPGLGGFVANTRSGHIQDASGVIMPPAKWVAFNASLKHQDGLLVNALAAGTGLTYTDARQQVEAWVEKLWATLNTARHCQVGFIGTFSLDKEDNLFFQAAAGNNFLLEAYGLAPVKARVHETRVPEPAVKPKPELSKTTVEEVTRAIPVIEKAEDIMAVPVQRKSSRWVAAALLGIMAVTATSLWRYTYTQQVQRGSIIEIPAQQEQPKQPEVTAQAEETVEMNTIVPEQSASAEPGTAVSREQAAAAVAEAPVTEAATATSAADSTFYIIGGAFARSSNADKFVVQLRAKGYEAKAVDGAGTRLRRVSYAQYPSRSEAEKALILIQQKENPEAWVLALP